MVTNDAAFSVSFLFRNFYVPLTYEMQIFREQARGGSIATVPTDAYDDFTVFVLSLKSDIDLRCW